MDLYEKIEILGPGAQYDTCGPRDLGKTTRVPGVYYAKTGGGTCRLFKVLQTNACKNNCNYCAFRRDRSCKRAAASPDEMAQAFGMVWQKRLVDGLFLSSGIVDNPDTTMTKLLDTLHILRDKQHYRGYIHLKMMPGTSASCIRESLKLANRVSLNIESPTEDDLQILSPDKNLKSGFFETMSEIKNEIEKVKNEGKRVPSMTTQFVVGAGRENDADLVKMTKYLYDQFSLARVFYSSFRPI